MVLRAFLKTHLFSLVYEGEADVREVPNEELDIKVDEGGTPFYTATD